MRKRLFTDKQETAALAEFRAANGRRGAKAALANRYGCSGQVMALVIKRAEARELANVPRETCQVPGARQ